MSIQMYEHISKSRLDAWFRASAFLAPDVMLRRTTSFLPFPKMRGTTPGPHPTVSLRNSSSQIQAWAGNCSPKTPRTSCHTHNIMCHVTSASTPICKTNYKWCHYPIEDLCLLAMHPFPLLISWLHILFREWPCGSLNDWPQLSTPPCIHTLCHVILLFLLLEARNISQPQGCWAWHCDLLWQMNASESKNVLVWAGFKKQQVST